MHQIRALFHPLTSRNCCVAARSRLISDKGNLCIKSELISSQVKKWRIVTSGVSGPISLYTVVPRTEGNTYDVGLWALSIMQGSFSLVPNPNCVCRRAPPFFPSPCARDSAARRSSRWASRRRQTR
jgi:hypothetical protein